MRTTLAGMAGAPNPGSASRDRLWVGGITLAYFLIAVLSLSFETDEGMAVICVPAGLFLPALLLTRHDLRWPLAAALAFAHLLAERVTGTPLIACVGYAVAMTADAVLAVWLLDRWLGERLHFERVRHVVLWMAGAVVLTNGLASGIAALTAMQLSGSSFAGSYLRWASSDGVANLLLTPFVLLWWDRLHFARFRPWRVVEGVLLIGGVIVLAGGLFVQFAGSNWIHLMLPYAVVPFVLWAALRFEARGVATLLVALAAVAIPLTYRGVLIGDVLAVGLREQVIVVQVVLAMIAAPALILTAVVAERRNADRERAENEQLFSTVFRDGPTAMSLVRADTDVHVDVNDAFLQLTGHRRDDVIGRTVTELGLIERPEDFASIREAIAAGRLSAMPLEIRRGDGTVRETLVSANPMSLNNGIFVLTTIQDVTESVRSEQAVRESQSFLSESQRVARIGSYDVDFVAGRWKSSEVLDDIFGIGPDDDRSVMGWLQLIHADDQAHMAEYLQQEVLGRRQRFDREYRIVRRCDGTVRWVHGLGQLTMDATGAVVSMMGTIQDITDAKRAEEENARLEDRLRQSQKMEAVGRLAGGVAHDFNNMLGVILGHTELASFEPGLTPPLREHLQAIGGAATRSAELTRQLLAFARKQSIAPKVLDLNDIIASSLKLLRRLIGEDLNLEWRPGPALWPVKIDPSQIDQMLANLCVNARDAMSGAGSIQISTHRVTVSAAGAALHADRAPGDYVVLTVSDTGCGMSDEVKAHLFEPFFTTKPLGAGTGLGLSSVYGAVTQNGGFVTVDSAVGRGTSIAVHLPRTTETAVGASVRATTTTHRGEETILVVEDERSLLRMTQQVLQSHGYRVITAGSAEEAADAAVDSGGIDLLLTDVIMPGEHGLHLAERLAPIGGRTKRLFMSGYTADVIATRGEIPPGTPFIEKPFTSGQLASKVRQVLDAVS